MEAPKRGHRTISLNASLVTDVESYIQTHPEYRSIAAFFEEAARIRMQELKVHAT